MTTGNLRRQFETDVEVNPGRVPGRNREIRNSILIMRMPFRVLRVKSKIKRTYSMRYDLDIRTSEERGAAPYGAFFIIIGRLDRAISFFARGD